jgi:hypothetical protein
MIVWAKVGGILAAIALVFFAGYRFGGMASKTALEGFQAAQAENTAKAVLAERASTAATLAHQNAVIEGYQNAPISPIVTTAAQRVFVYATHAASCAVSGAAPNAGGAPAAAAVALGPSRVVEALGAYIAACDADSRRLAALQALSPH